MIRVIAGKFKGRKLASHRSGFFRPTLDRVKESIFNVLGDSVESKYVLDLFCGSGSLGIEAISRGASRVVFVDNSKIVLDIAKKNIKALALESQAKLALLDVFDLDRLVFKKLLRNSDNDRSISGFDIIFADPPYDKYYGNMICELLIKQDILCAGGIFVLERFKKESPGHNKLKLIKQLKFGQTEVDFFIRCASS
jgi:16S rRNA (guanine(966)-N(2))-methyltransferase RsmD